ncbi:MAG: helix-turn-helix domain-containing protein [Phycisphaera sp.]|nr:helix-turn-helix domain-containing protein [Phycisphaera sp.]
MSPKPSVIEHYTGRSRVLPELAVLGYDSHVAASRRLAGHVHPDAYEVCYISKGQVSWWVGREVYRVGKGDLYITRPGEEHGGVGSMMHTCELYFFQITFRKGRALPGLTAEQTRRIAKAFAGFGHRSFPASRAVREGFIKMMAAQRSGGELAQVAARSALHEVLLGVIEDHRRAAQSRTGRESDKSGVVLDAMHWIDAHLDQNARVEEIACAVGLGVSRFHERFMDEVGFSPNDYRTRRRIEVAKAMLCQGNQPATQIALRLGFTTSQYFATVFRRHTGLSPVAFRKEMSVG